jgi:hypothetical protein
MPEPLDYFTPGARDPRSEDPRDRRSAAIPIEFDALLTRTCDHPAARAVEAELARQGIRFFRTETGSLTERAVELHVRSADHVRASQLAAMMFARRRRLNQISPRRKGPIDSLIPHADPGGGSPGVP